MVTYLDALFGVNFLVNYLLLVGSARLSAMPAKRPRLAAAAVLGGLYAVGVYLPGLGWLQVPGMQMAAAACMVLCGFGLRRGAGRQLLLLLTLSFALGGTMLVLSSILGSWQVRGGAVYYPISPKALLITAAAAYGVTSLVFSRLAAHGGGELVSLQLRLGERTVSLRVLIDTGNSLRDPLTGRPVVVVDWSIACQLLPKPARRLWTQDALSDPAALLTILHLAAPELQLRLIPYKAVGVPHALLLAVRCDEITVGGKTHPGGLAAFSPTPVSDGGGCAALAYSGA